MQDHREEGDENAGLGRLRPTRVSSLWTVTEAGEVTVPLVDDEHEAGTGDLSPQL